MKVEVAAAVVVGANRSVMDEAVLFAGAAMIGLGAGAGTGI